MTDPWSSGTDIMQAVLINIWNQISTLGITKTSSPAEIRLIKTLNRLSLIAALSVFPFVVPAINPTYDTFGWIEFISGLGFLSILGANSLQKYRIASFLLVLTVNFKIFFSASSRGWEAGEQLFFIPLCVGILLLYDIRKQKSAWIVWGMSLAVFISLEITKYELLIPASGYAESVIKEIFTLNFLICAVIIFATTFYYSRLSIQQQEEILKSQEQVLNASRVKSEFLSVISHELKTPLHAILNYSEMLSETGLDSEQEELNSGVRVSGKKLSEIVTQILSVSQIDGEYDPLEITTFVPHTLLHQVVEHFKTQAENKNLQLKVIDNNQSKTLIKADQSRILQILSLLVDNAIKFSNSGSILLRSEIIREKNDQNGQLLYQVEDQGLGISKADLVEVFTPFFMNDSSRNRTNGGMGLGLTISKRLIESMDGQIHIQSTLHEGSTFSVQIPIEIQPPKNTDTIHMTQEDQLQIPTINVLLVDDHPVNQKVASTMLRKLGYSYDLAKNGEEAVEAAGSGKFHLILMDIQMPVMDGIEATRRIRADLAQERQPIIIALTANTTEGDRKACFDAGMEDFLAKPVTKSAIEKAIDKWKAKVPHLS